MRISFDVDDTLVCGPSVPVEQPLLSDMTEDEIKNPDLRNLIWAQEVWHSIKRHWVIELQRLIRARRANGHVT